MIKKLLCIVPMLVLSVILSGCTADTPGEAPKQVMREVYSDETLEIDASSPRVLVSTDGQSYYAVRLHISNRAVEPIAVSTRLSFLVEYGEESLECAVLPEGVSASDAQGSLDGLIMPDGYADGWLMFPYREPRVMRMAFSIDPVRGETVSFELPACQ